VATPEIEKSYCHTVSYTCGVAAGRALRGEEVSSLADAVEAELAAEPLEISGHERFVVAGAGSDTATVLEAVLKLREGVHVAAEAHHTEQLLHGHLAAIDSSVRCFVLEGEGPAAERAQDAVRALGELGCQTTLVPSSHPVVDIVRFQRLTVDLADDRGIDPDLIRWDEERWDWARRSYG
jgi:glutamine---fructose-6-phosphate transaminase (isomerizing)